MKRPMHWIGAGVASLLIVVWAVGAQETVNSPPKIEPPTSTTQPAPADAPGNQRPAQAEMIRRLLDRDRRPPAISPEGGVASDAPAVDPDGNPLLPDGAMVFERSGRLVREGERSRFVFQLQPSDPKLRSMEILPNQLREAMEREAAAGFTEFIVSAEVTRYDGRNFLLLKKILRRVSHGNLGP